MKHRKLIAFAGAAILASSTALLTGAPSAFAAADAGAPIPFSFSVPGACTVTGTLSEDRDSSGAYVVVHLVSDLCGIGVEAGIQGPGGTPAPCWGGDVHQNGDNSMTCHIPVNSGNQHGYRNWNYIINNWVSDWNF